MGSSLTDGADSVTDTEAGAPREHKRIAFLVAAEGIERVELEDPWTAVVEAGHDAVLIANW